MNSHNDESTDASPSRYRVRLPGFVGDEEEIGLGDVVSRVTSTFRIRPCGSCRRRAATLNRWMTFDGRPR